MPHFPSVPKGESLAFVLARFNTGVEKPLMQMHQNLMRNDESPLSLAEREMIAAYVSGVAKCNYCYGTHVLIAEQFGMKEGLVKDLLEDLNMADIDEKFKPILRYVKKVTIDPTRIVQSDIDDVLGAGWSERALYDALMICCTWNFVNRLVDGIGLDVSPEQHHNSARMLKKGYDQVIEKRKLK